MPPVRSRSLFGGTASEVTHALTGTDRPSRLAKRLRLHLDGESLARPGRSARHRRIRARFGWRLAGKRATGVGLLLASAFVVLDARALSHEASSEGARHMVVMQPCRD